jgi:Cu(I)/Ag(I) efflux system membrane fusion protein
MTCKNSLIVSIAVAACGLSFVLGLLVAPTGSDGTVPVVGGAESSQTFYCSMHPHIRKLGPGKCDVCGMDLIPLEETSDAGSRMLEVSESAMRLAEIETVRVERKNVSRSVPMVGKVSFDETRVKTITAWVSGRLDRLYVNYEGVPVKKGEHLADIYSPELLAAQQVLREARRVIDELSESDSSLVYNSSLDTLKAVKDKLRRLGLTDDQVAEIETRSTESDHIVINAPMGGVVIRKFASEGEYVKTGRPLYEIADLTQVWIKLDAYESDLAWLRYGQDVEFSTLAYPGEVFHGKILFIDWVVDPKTRTVKVRINVDNTDRRLKPGMLVRAEVRAQLGEGGLVLAPELKGKWISPMHPEIVKDGPGSCDICGMDLVPAEELFRDEPGKRGPPLVIPASAALVTGRRAVVYVRVPDREAPTFEGREIVLGPRAGDEYVVLDGLSEGELVVVRGNFKIDSALQILARPSMMNPDGGRSPGVHDHGQHESDEGHSNKASSKDTVELLESDSAFQTSLAPLFSRYFAMGEALAGDNVETSRSAAVEFREALGRVQSEEMPPRSRDEWNEIAAAFGKALVDMSGDDIEALRRRFRTVSQLLIRAERSFGHSDGKTHYETFCPMAFDGEGDSWLQLDKGIANPYFGASMLRCGSVRREFGSMTTATDPDENEGHGDHRDEHNESDPEQEPKHD